MQTQDNWQGTQSPAQWAVRYLAVAGLGALAASVPLAHVGWHIALQNPEPMYSTRHQKPLPTPTLSSLADGSYMAQTEKSLQESAPFTWHLRSNWHELRLALGWPRGTDVRVGQDDWFFLAESLAPDIDSWKRGRGARMALLQQVKSSVEATGAKLVISLVPDKERVYPDKWYPNGDMPDNKRGNYALALAEFSEAGIRAIDLALAMEQGRVSHPGVDLYFRRDTHWNVAGAFVASSAMASFLEGNYSAAIGPRMKASARSTGKSLLVGDLVGMMGLGTLDLRINGAADLTHPEAFSLITYKLRELVESYAIDIADTESAKLVDGNDSEACVWLVGTSFANANGAAALALQLARPIRWTIQFGASGLSAMRAALPEMSKQRQARLVVWEIVERGYFSPEWSSSSIPTAVSSGG